MQWLSMTSAIRRCLCARACTCVFASVLFFSACGLTFEMCLPMSADMSLPACSVSLCVFVPERGDTLEKWKKLTLQSSDSLYVPLSTITHLFYSCPSLLSLSLPFLPSLSRSLFSSLSLLLFFLLSLSLSLSLSLHYHCSNIKQARDRECSCLGVLQRGQ